MSKIYALLVGINDYDPKVGKLEGCVNDVNNFNDYLHANYDNTNLAIETLKDHDATYENIVAQFRNHLGRAQEDDIALFHYCGHGAQSGAAPAFREFFSSGKDEGLVCIDSRNEGGYDLADKELAVLIAEVARNSPHISVILDCCHSGSGTRNADASRGMRVRQTHENPYIRELESYVGGHFSEMQNRGEPLSVPSSKHILLAACDRKQTAKEDGETKSGIFTSSLLNVLEQKEGNISYSELFVKTRVATRSRADKQDPQFEAARNFNAASGFLGRELSRVGDRPRVYFDQGQWFVEMGATKGLVTEPGSEITLALYAEDEQKEVIGNAAVVEVGPAMSVVEPTFEVDTKTFYRAELSSLPPAPILVHFDGPEEWQAILQQALDADSATGIELTDNAAGTSYALLGKGNQVQLRQLETGTLVHSVRVNPENLEAAMALLLPLLRTVTTWERGVKMRKPNLHPNDSGVDFFFSEKLDNGEDFVHETGDVTLDYREVSGSWQVIRGKFQVRNRTGKNVHALLLNYSKDYGVTLLRNEEIEADDNLVTIWGDDPDHGLFLDDGENESIEQLKLIISSKRIEDFLLVQDPIELGGVSQSLRGMGSIKQKILLDNKNDWFTEDRKIKIVRRLDQLGDHGDLSLPGGKIVVKQHKSVTGNVSLSAAKSTMRNVTGEQGLFRELEENGISLVSFSGTRGEHENILEITDIQNAGDLKDNPLEVELNVSLGPDEAILPVVFDGQHVLLGGDSYQDDSGKTKISIDHLYEVPDNRRSLGGALKLYFFKSVMKRNVNKLQWVDFKDDGSIDRYEADVPEKVADARNILLLVHGIIGDTEDIAKGIQDCNLNEQFDLVLAYDYENLATPIDETGSDLKKQLTQAGLAEDDNKRLTIVAHSMGGLVSRSMIERDRGDKLVDHLVMCGTPNNGSPFGKIGDVRKILNIITAVSMNYIPALVPFSSPLLMALNFSKKLTPCLEQMNPDSDFLKMLNSSDDPGIPYTILAGNIGAYQEPTDQFFSNLIAKAGKSTPLEKLFSDLPNDIAVGVESIRSVATNRTTQPVFSDVACHHLNYFSSEAGQNELKSVDWSR